MSNFTKIDRKISIWAKIDNTNKHFTCTPTFLSAVKVTMWGVPEWESPTAECQCWESVYE